jgi:gliding motility-associated-like protein
MKTSTLLTSFFISISFLSEAQLCNGNLGDAIVNITFGTQHASIPLTATTFEYTPSCPSKGQYNINNLIFGCGNHTWMTIAGDHTGDVNGNYMLVNTESTPGTVHVDTATGLCGNTTYQYTAWICNVMQKFSCNGNAVLPNLTFTVKTISGVVLATYNTDDIPILNEKVWKQYGLSFQAPANVSSVILSITTNPKPGCGSAFAIDDITFRPCGPSVIATIDGKTEPANVCADYTNPFILNASYSPGFTNPVVQWQSSLDTGKTWKDIPTATSTTYAIPHRSLGVVLYRMAVAEQANINSIDCRILSNAIYTSVNPLAPHHTPQNIIGCLGKNLILPETDPKALNILWTGRNGYSSTLEKSIVANVSYADTGLYILEQDFYFSCVSLDSFYLKVYPSTTISTQAVYSICEGNKINLSASGDGSFDWEPSAGLSNNHIANPIASPHDTTQYKVVLTNSFGCKDSALVTVNVFRNPEVSAGIDKTIIKGDTIELNGYVKGTAINFYWSPGTFMDNSQILHPKVFPPQNIQYTLTAVSTVGCGVANASIMIKVYNDIYIPTGFTPNGDGKNDYFKVTAADGYKLIKFQVYNRWGLVVYDVRDLNTGWDGTYKNLSQPADTYVYFLEIESSKGKKIIKSGTITLVR